MVHQCAFGAASAKPTDFAGNVADNIEERRCEHPVRTWRLYPDGKRLRGAHAPLVGKVAAIDEESWAQGKRFESNSAFLTKQRAAYPPDLNRHLAEVLVVTALVRLHPVPKQIARKTKTEPEPQTQSLIRVGRWQNTLVRSDLVLDSPEEPPRNGFVMIRARLKMEVLNCRPLVCDSWSLCGRTTT